MSHKATKKLIAQAIENQKSAPKALLPKFGTVVMIEHDLRMQKVMSEPRRSAMVSNSLIAPIAPVVKNMIDAQDASEKLRGYKVKDPFQDGRGIASAPGHRRF